MNNNHTKSERSRTVVNEVRESTAIMNHAKGSTVAVDEVRCYIIL